MFNARKPASVPEPAAERLVRPRALALVCLLLLVQAASLTGLGVAWATDLVRGRSELPAATVFLSVFALGIAAVLILGARGLWKGRRWARSPVITWQLLLVVLSIGWLRTETSAWAVAVLASAVVIIAGLFGPRVLGATSARPGQ